MAARTDVRIDVMYVMWEESQKEVLFFLAGPSAFCLFTSNLSALGRLDVRQRNLPGFLF